jgi:hypothetical protein
MTVILCGKRLPLEVMKQYEFYGMKAEPELYREKYFITSRMLESGWRKYTIRKMESEGNARVFGEVNGFSTKESAVRWLVGRNG